MSATHYFVLLFVWMLIVLFVGFLMNLVFELPNDPLLLRSQH